jgi:hypothetical protein
MWTEEHHNTKLFMASDLFFFSEFKICEIFAVCLAHAIGKLISGYKSKTLCRRIYDTAICGRWTDVNPVNDQLLCQERCIADKDIILQDVHVLLLRFRAVITNNGESGIFMDF